MRAFAAPLRYLRPRGDGSPGDGAASSGTDRVKRSHAAVMVPILLGCLALSALTLLFPTTPTYDPWAWILWGREILHLDLVTEGGPSWKPLPVFFTVPFALFGQDLAPFLWVWVARAGGLFGCVMAYRVAYRLIFTEMGREGEERLGRAFGVLAGVCAFLALLSSNKYARDAALGNSEPLLAALALWAFERHLDGRRDHALYLGVACALLRPEAWPFLGLYGLWLWFREPRLRARMVGFALLVPACWFLPEWWGSGDPFRAGARANAPNPGSAAFADSPAVELFQRFRLVTIAPVELGTMIAVGFAVTMWARARRYGATLALTAGGLAWFALVAVMTEAGFAGNQRYLIVTTAVLCVLGGMGTVLILAGMRWLGGRVLGESRAWIPTAVALLVGVAVALPTVVAKGNNFARVTGGLEHEAYLWHDLKTLIDKAGGKEAILACSKVWSGPFQTQMVGYELGIHGLDVGWFEPPAPGAVFRTRTVPDGPLVTTPNDDRYRLVATNGKWRLLTVPPEGGGGECPSAGPDSPTAPLPTDQGPTAPARIGGGRGDH